MVQRYPLPLSAAILSFGQFAIFKIPTFGDCVPQFNLLPLLKFYKGFLMDDKYVEVDKMSDLISDDYRLLQVISRFGLNLGFGDKTVKEVCGEQNVDYRTFLAVVNFTKFGDKVADYWVEKISVKALTEYLRNSHVYFLEFFLPGIRRKLLEAVDCSSRNEVAFLTLKFFDEYVAEVPRHMEDENNRVFPYIDSLIAGSPDESISFDMEVMHQQPIEQKITELKNIIIKYYNIPGDSNLLNTVLFDIFLCEEDLHIHYRMEKALFIPAVKNMEEHVREQLESQSDDDDSSDDDSNVLSNREKEIVISVVKGLTNKEIADHLFISVNTVTTHRRNIARKLDIHSGAGLAIYAIVNKLVNIEDIRDSVE